MTTAASRELVRAFFQARLSCDPVQIAPLLDDDIEWSITGPVDVLRYAGHRRGKQAVLDAIVHQGTDIFQVRNVAIDDVVVDGDNAMTRTRVSGVHGVTGRSISYQCAQLLRFRDGKLVQFRAIIDSFDATEQVLGREIDLTGAPSVQPAINQSAI